jgi:hypothetical protein
MLPRINIWSNSSWRSSGNRLIIQNRWEFLAITYRPALALALAATLAQVFEEDPLRFRRLPAMEEEPQVCK